MKDLIFWLAISVCVVVGIVLSARGPHMTKPQQVAKLIAINAELMGELRPDVLADRQQRAALQRQRKNIVEMKGPQ